ncbi:GNAT family N-acetyltransferase, partial [Chloroflexota bacterium]
TIKITSSRLILREYTEADFQGVHMYAKDPETVRFMTWGPNSHQETRDFIELAISQQSIEPRRNYHFAVTLKENNHLVGGCGIHCHRMLHKSAEIGYCFNKQFWMQGYATETTGALLKFGFESMQMHRIIARCHPDNVGSERVMQKNGLRKEAHFVQELWQREQWRDSLLYAILDSEWFENQINHPTNTSFPK